MISAFQCHPFAVDAFFERSVVLTYAFPQEQLKPLLPPNLTLDTYENFGFVAAAMVQTKNLRASGFPPQLGNDFFLIGFRIFVRYTDKRGKNLRGLYILKSETDKKKMEFFGNIFTKYQYTTTDISNINHNGITTYSSRKSDFSVSINENAENIPLPQNSPFPDWKTARRYAGPLPFTFTWFPEKKEILIIEGERSNWKPQPISIKNHHFGFFQDWKLTNGILANAFDVKNIPYTWKKGRKESW
ncbi:MAG: DUF2071 domain-containing protein [Cryomorphaceae bacterium]|nr:DUF2071 domain-containing protein [Cryomorphaceae bacterium]